MCGRFKLTLSIPQMKKLFQAKSKIEELIARDQVFPTQQVPVLFVEPETGELVIEEMKWGLVPFYDKAEKPRGLINARSETVGDKPAFKKAFQERRCIVPADGFYEWDKKTKERHYFAPDQGHFTFAGIWQPHKCGEQIENTFTILTTRANTQVEPIHDRMPVALSHNVMGAWLSPETDTEALKGLLEPWPDAQTTATNQGTGKGSPKENSDTVNAEAAPPANAKEQLSLI